MFRFGVTGFALTGGNSVHIEGDLRWKLIGQGDFDGDGRSDLLWRHDVDGRVYVMQIGVSGTPSGGAVVHTETNRSWRIVQVADLDGDGKADIVWWNATTGQVWLQLMDGVAIKTQGLLHTEPDTNWRIVSAGAFAAGNAQQLVWRHRTNGLTYRMTLTSNTAPFTKQWDLIATDPEPWIVVGTGDFNADGVADVLWRNVDTGAVRVSITNGAATVVHTEPNPDWRVVAIGDYNGDGKTDLLWRNFASGEVYLMYMNGAAIASGGQAYFEPNQRWRILGENDFSDNDWVGYGVTDDFAAVLRLDKSNRTVPASCEGSLRVNCPNGTPTPTSLTTAVSNFTLLQSGVINFDLEFSAPGVVMEDTSVTPARTCTVSFNSIPGSATRVSVNTTKSYYSSNNGGPNDRAYLQTNSPGIETADYTTNCSGTSAYLGDIARFYFQNHLGYRFTGILCGAPGPDIYGTCP